MQPMSNLLRMLPLCSTQASVFEPQLPRQARDAAKGRKLLLLDKKALLRAAKAGDETKVMLVPTHRLSVPAACTARP